MDWKTNVVIVEDDPNQRKILALVLNNEGYAVHTAASGEEGLELVRNVLPALLITDVMLPTLDGFELCRRLRRDPATAHIPIIFVTALTGVQDKRMGFDLGADAYMTKPYSTRDIVAQIKTVLRRAEPAAGKKSLQPRVLLTGQLATASVVDVLQTIGSNGITGRLEVSGAEHGSIDLRSGQMLHAQVTTPRKEITGIKAWYRLVTWSEGFFELRDQEDPEMARRRGTALQGLLMESAYYRDEYERVRSLLPGFDIMLLRAGEIEADARPNQRRVWDAVGQDGIELATLLDELEYTDLEILQCVFALLERGLLVATVSFGRSSSPRK